MSRAVDGPVRVEAHEGGKLWRILLDAPRANILDSAMIGALTQLFERAATEKTLRAVCVEGVGPNFSFGASVEEHLPEKVGRMLPTFHRLFRVMLDSRCVLLSAVRGKCLGGGLELAAVCQRVFAAPEAELGQPEVRLGVFAPLGSLVLPARVGHGAAADLCLSGRGMSAVAAQSIGLVDEVADDPFAAALSYAKSHLLGHSAASLRHAVRALQIGTLPNLLERLDLVERLYLEELMATKDADEGIRSFLEKRRPIWRNE